MKLTGVQEALLWIAAIAAIYGVVLTLVGALVGQPPVHCRYLVAVASKPGVYACSQYPRPVGKP